MTAGISAKSEAGYHKKLYLIVLLEREAFMRKYKTFKRDNAMAMRRFLLLLLLSPIIFIFNCASSETIRFENNIQSMSNAELINRYHGINDRIKDVENSIRKDEGADFSQNQQIISHQTYFVGGEIYGLMQKGKLVLDEMEKRNLSP